MPILPEKIFYQNLIPDGIRTFIVLQPHIISEASVKATAQRHRPRERMSFNKIKDSYWYT